MNYCLETSHFRLNKLKSTGLLTKELYCSTSCPKSLCVIALSWTESPAAFLIFSVTFKKWKLPSATVLPLKTVTAYGTHLVLVAKLDALWKSLNFLLPQRKGRTLTRFAGLLLIYTFCVDFSDPLFEVSVCLSVCLMFSCGKIPLCSPGWPQAQNNSSASASKEGSDFSSFSSRLPQVTRALWDSSPLLGSCCQIWLVSFSKPTFYVLSISLCSILPPMNHIWARVNIRYSPSHQKSSPFHTVPFSVPWPPGCFLSSYQKLVAVYHEPPKHQGAA